MISDSIRTAPGFNWGGAQRRSMIVRAAATDWIHPTPTSPRLLNALLLVLLDQALSKTHTPFATVTLFLLLPVP